MKLKPIASNMTVLEPNLSTSILFSYETPVAAFISGKGFIKTEKKWSATTTRHINKWQAMTCPNATVSTKPQEWFDALV